MRRLTRPPPPLPRLRHPGHPDPLGVGPDRDPSPSSVRGGPAARPSIPAGADPPQLDPGPLRHVLLSRGRPARDHRLGSRRRLPGGGERPHAGALPPRVVEVSEPMTPIDNVPLRRRRGGSPSEACVLLLLVLILGLVLTSTALRPLRPSDPSTAGQLAGGDLRGPEPAGSPRGRGRTAGRRL